MPRGSVTILLAIAIAAAGPGIAARDPSAAPPTFSREIRTILQAHCATCHSPGGPAPMALVSYDQVLPWARSIKEQTLTRRMPQWHAARGYGAFANDPTLTPHELRLISSWVDAGSPRGEPQITSEPSEQSRPGLAIPASAATATVWTRSGWVTGWDFTPGDPLITSAALTSGDGAGIGTWVAGDGAVRLPRASAIRVVPPVHVQIFRRDKTGYEAPFAAGRSVLRLNWAILQSSQSRGGVTRRVWTERMACGWSLGPTESSILGIRPVLRSGAAVQLTVERLGGAQPVLLAWFRDFDPAYARIYWLQEPLEFAAGARISGDAPCELDVILSARR